MANNTNNELKEEEEATLNGKFTGEESSSGYSSPRNDFTSSAIVGVLGLAALWMATKLEYPDTVLTSPGVFPFFTGACLIIMATALSFSAFKRSRNNGQNNKKNNISDKQIKKTYILAITVFFYVFLLDKIEFTWRYHTQVYTFSIGSFEIISIPVITGILWYFWRETILKCLGVSALMTFFLAIVFRDGFQILLPGSG